MGLITNFCCVNCSGVLCILCTKNYQIKLLFLRAKPEESHKVQAGLSYWARSSCWIQFLRFSCWANSPIRVFVLGKGFLLDSFKAFSRTSLHRLSQSTQNYHAARQPPCRPCTTGASFTGRRDGSCALLAAAPVQQCRAAVSPHARIIPADRNRAP